MLVGNGLQRPHVAHQAVKMHRHDGTGVGGDGGLDARRIEVAGVGLDIDEHRRGAGLEDGRGGGDEAHRRGDDLVARPDIERQQRHVQRPRAARHGQGVALLEIGRKPRLELRHVRACREDVAFQHLGEAVELGLAEVVAEVGDLPGHHWRVRPATLLATGGRRASRPARLAGQRSQAGQRIGRNAGFPVGSRGSTRPTVAHGGLPHLAVRSLETTLALVISVCAMQLGAPDQP